MIILSCNGGETLPVTMNISKLRTVRARCVQLPLGAGLGANCATLMLVRPPGLPLMVMGVGCELRNKRGQIKDDAQLHARCKCTSNECSHPYA